MGSASVQRSGPDGLGWPELPREPYYQFRKAAHHRHAASFPPFFLNKTGKWFVSSHGCHRGNKLNGKQTPRAPWLACPAPTNQALTRRPQRDKVSGVLNDLRLRERERDGHVLQQPGHARLGFSTPLSQPRVPLSSSSSFLKHR
jgi:hypothetical protein